MTITYEKACKEVIEILKLLPKEEYEKIPIEEIEVLEKNKDNSYEFNIDTDQINISRKAKAIIVYLWEKYFASDIQKEKLKTILKENYIKQEEKKKKEYDYDKMFPKKKEDIKTIIVVKKEKWYQKIYKVIKQLFS